MKKLILFLIIIAGITEGCKKYEEGPWLSLRSAKNRLYGDYTLVQYTVNDEDSLSLYNDSLCDTLKFIFDTNLDLDVCYIYGNRNDGKISSLVWYWNLKDKNTSLVISYSNCSSGTGPFSDKVKPEWKILRLTTRQIKMKTIYNNKEYTIMLESIIL